MREGDEGKRGQRSSARAPPQLHAYGERDEERRKTDSGVRAIQMSLPVQGNRRQSRASLLVRKMPPRGGPGGAGPVSRVNTCPRRLVEGTRLLTPPKPDRVAARDSSASGARGLSVKRGRRRLSRASLRAHPRARPSTSWTHCHAKLQALTSIALRTSGGQARGGKVGTALAVSWTSELGAGSEVDDGQEARQRPGREGQKASVHVSSKCPSTSRTT